MDDIEVNRWYLPFYQSTTPTPLTTSTSRKRRINMSSLRKLIPLADRVLVRRLMPVSKTAGGIILPESTVSKANEGEVLAIGTGIKSKDGADIPITVAVGDKVLLPDYGGLMVKMDGEDVYLFRNDEILAKFSN